MLSGACRGPGLVIFSLVQVTYCLPLPQGFLVTGESPHLWGGGRGETEMVSGAMIYSQV